jgi:hypothetical protein
MRIFAHVLTTLLAGAATLSATACGNNALMLLDRTIRKEPTYQSGTPQYCLLAFGSRAQAPIWVVLDIVSEPYKTSQKQDVLYIDRNGNGDLTEPGEKVAVTLLEHEEDRALTTTFSLSQATLEAWEKNPKLRFVKRYTPRFNIGTLVVKDGKTKVTDMVMEVAPSYIGKYRPCSLSLKVPGRGVQSASSDLLRFGNSPKNAPIIHLNGPLTGRVAMEDGSLHIPIDYTGGEPAPPWYEERTLQRGKTSALYVEFGTPGLGRGTFVSLSTSEIPASVYPIADIEFLHQDATKPPLHVRCELTGRCCGTLFSGDVFVPAEAALGKAKVTISFPGWKAGRIHPAQGEVTVAAP